MGEREAGAKLRRPKFTEAFIDRYGEVRHYFRRNGIRIALPGLPFSSEYMAAYSAALTGALREPQGAGAGRTIAGSLRAGAVAYLGSAEWQAFAPTSRKMRRPIIEKFCEIAGDKPLARLKHADIARMLSQSNLSPAAQRNWIRAIRPVMRHAMSLGMIPHDPTSGYRPPRMPKTEGFKPWTEQDVERFTARWPLGTRQHLALVLALWTDQRRSDIAAMGRQHIGHTLDKETGRMVEVIHVRQQKTGKRLAIPIAGELAEAIRITVPSDQLPFLCSEHGKPFRPESLGSWFGQACRAAGLKDKTMHGLRKLQLVRGANAGLGVHGLASLSGHTNLKEVAHYTQSVDQAQLAIEAIRRIEQAQKANESSEKLPNRAIQFGKSAKKRS